MKAGIVSPERPWNGEVLELYEDQQVVFERTLAALAESRTTTRPPRIMLQMPTAAGKTIVALAVLRELYDPTRPYVWLTHRKELELQSGKKAERFGMPITTFRGQRVSSRTFEPGVMTLVSPSMQYPVPPANAGLLVADEGHHSVAKTWEGWILDWPGPVLALSATPRRLDRTQGFDHLFEVLVCGAQIEELVEVGRLARPILVRPPHGASISPSELRRRGGDYTSRSAERAALRLIGTGLAVNEWDTLSSQFGINKVRTLWFAPTKASAAATVEDLAASGHGAKLLLEDTPLGERRRIIAEFDAGKLLHVVSVDILGEGLDVVDCESIVMLRPTLSLPRYLQMCGRGMRKKAGANRVYIFDFARNVESHGLPDARRTWSLLAPAKAPDPNDLDWTKAHHQCILCGTMHAGVPRTCQGCQAPLGQMCSGGRYRDQDYDGCSRWRYWRRYELYDRKAITREAAVALVERVGSDPHCLECRESADSVLDKADILARVIRAGWRSARDKWVKMFNADENSRLGIRWALFKDTGRLCRQQMEPGNYGAGSVRWVNTDIYQLDGYEKGRPAWWKARADRVIVDHSRPLVNPDAHRTIVPAWSLTKRGDKMRLMVDACVWLWTEDEAKLITKPDKPPHARWRKFGDITSVEEATKVVSGEHSIALPGPEPITEEALTEKAYEWSAMLEDLRSALRSAGSGDIPRDARWLHEAEGRVGDLLGLLASASNN